MKTNYKFKAMGGIFDLNCFPQSLFSQDHVNGLFQSSQKLIERIETKLTDFKESPFNQINKFAGIKPIIVDKETLDLIKRSLEISKKSQGAFDISFASVGHLWRKAKKEKTILASNDRATYQKFINYKNIIINENDNTVYLPHKNMKIGLGGIGKGYAVDKVFDFLLTEGLVNFSVNGSGDVRVHSHPSAPRAWQVGIRNPFSKNRKKMMGYVRLTTGAIATSGTYIQKNTLNKTYQDHHIINPKTGLGHSEIISATVIASNSLIADTTATILLNLNSHKALEYLKENQLKGIIVKQDGKVLRID